MKKINELIEKCKDQLDNNPSWNEAKAYNVGIETCIDFIQNYKELSKSEVVSDEEIEKWHYFLAGKGEIAEEIACFITDNTNWMQDKLYRSKKECEICGSTDEHIFNNPSCNCNKDLEERKCTLGKVFKNCSNWTPLNSQGCLGCDHYKIQDQEECWACFKKLPKGHKSGLCLDCQIRG